MSSRRRRWSVLALVVALLAGLTTFLVWPRHQTPGQMASVAAQSLRAWHGVNYAGAAVDGDGVITRVRMTVASDGTAYGTLSRDFGAMAEIAVSPGRTLMRGNKQWWLGDKPSSADSLANTWILNPPPSVTGLLPASRLTPAALAGAVFDTDAVNWTQAGTASVSGHPARVLTNGTQRILVAASSPYRLLSVGLPVSGPSGHRATPSPSASASASASPGTRGVLTSIHYGRPHGVARVVNAGSGEAAPPTGLSSAVSEADDSQVQSTAAAVERLGETEAKPAQLSERVTVQPDVSVHLRSLSSNPCEARTCSAMVTVTNAGPGTANGKLTVSVAGQSALNTTVSVPPGASVPYTATAINTAPANTVMPVTWQAVLYNPAVMGNDPALVKRLAGRGFDLNKPVIKEQPNGKAILQTLDAMTTDIGPNTDRGRRADRISYVTSTIANVIRQRAFLPFYELVVMTDNLTVTDLVNFSEMRDNTARLSSPQDIRVLQHAADLARAGHKVTWGITYRPEGAPEGYKADILDLTARQAIQQETVTGGTSEVEDSFKEAVKRLKGETGEIPPPGFDKVARINIEPNATTPLAGMSRDDLLKELRRLNLHRHCAPTGPPVVDKVVFVNHPPGQDGVPTPATNVFTCADLRPQLTTDQRKQILDEQIWKANNDPVWFKKYYRTDGHRHDAKAEENGVELPVLAKDNKGNWISRDALPSGPSEVRLNPSTLDRASVDPKHIAHLDKVAKDRKVAADLSNAERAFEKESTAETQQALEDAQEAYRKQLGDRPNNSKIPEQLGEDAAKLHVVPEKFPGADLVELPKTANGANEFDQLYKFDDGSYLIVEAKAPKSDLQWRKGAGDAEGMMVKQGTRPYIQTIIAEMMTRSSKDVLAATDLLRALSQGKVQYVMVKASENTGTYAGAVLEHFKID
ncbi:hypothetical protein ACWGI8_24275 [Streptomyces sp. NPDC054841]